MKIKQCRICRSSSLKSLLNLGDQHFTGIFPKHESEQVPIGTLELVKCDKCDLVQLADSFDLNQLYGLNYGYRSGLNGSMVRHLNAKVQKIIQAVTLEEGDLVLDIGSNDGTTLKAYPNRNLTFVGIDPTAIKFRAHYPSDVQVIPDFFSAKLFKANFKSKKAKIVTSIAMFYDLEDPLAFMADVEDILDDKGMWVFEQSYLKSMLETNSYDTVCHEHLEYYGLKQIEWMANKSGLKILNVEFNDVNGGSFQVTAAKKNSPLTPNTKLIQSILEGEEKFGLYSMATYQNFAAKVEEHRQSIRSFFTWARDERKRVLGYGASTKGNVLLQYCGITADDLPCIAEVNEDKFGSFTPGTMIPIIDEATARRMKPDYF
ncbi:MAG: methyltransferase domain-containing protein, partial [Pseudomonadota bacterium]